MNSIARLEHHLAPLRKALDGRLEAIIHEAVRIQQIPAPTFDERLRAEYVQSCFAAIPTLCHIEIDPLHNVYACLPGASRTKPGLLISAHTDTVFDHNTPLDLHRSGDTISAPGIGDNSLGVAALITCAQMLADQRFPTDVWFVANSREEGLGDLGGIREVSERLTGKISAAIVIEGMALGRVYHAGIAVRRLKIRCLGPGGHSWLHFGRASAVHGLMHLGAQIAALKPPESPRTTYNIGVIEGGSTVNTIAAEASLLLDLRSESRDALQSLEQEVMNLIAQNRSVDLQFEVTVVGDRPAGAIPRSHSLPQLAQNVLQWMGVRPLFETGSTDANMLLAKGIPTVTIGITNGGNAHRTDEYIETSGILKGIWQLILLAVGTLEGLTD
ncbi:MAG: M20/M25/M40 family metallo-hydrolase [Anaerolinea sp.]|nr:M20/M25/M40 family metallo-hydrolase [Anaerolinea sp.]MCC6974841.1 M20/M25/M40 family metallo-hydrolase [Anaerolineae bacterium]